MDTHSHDMRPWARLAAAAASFVAVVHFCATMVRTDDRARARKFAQVSNSFPQSPQ